MRTCKAVFFVAALAAAEASASSIETIEPSASTPSIVTLADSASDPSIIAVAPLDGPAPSVVVLADTPAEDTPDVVTLGEPAPAGQAAAGSRRVPMPAVIRGGEVGTAFARPSPEPAAEPAPPLLDPNDRGTPAKRKALKRQAERLAREAEAAAQTPQQDPSTEPAPLGQ